MATTDIISKVSLNDSMVAMGQNSFCSISNSIEKSNFNLLGNENMTGRVGTALYVAPELLSANSKVVYNQVSGKSVFFLYIFYPKPLSPNDKQCQTLTVVVWFNINNELILVMCY